MLCRVEEGRGGSYWADTAHLGILRETDLQLTSPQVHNLYTFYTLGTLSYNMYLPLFRSAVPMWRWSWELESTPPLCFVGEESTWRSRAL